MLIKLTLKSKGFNNKNRHTWLRWVITVDLIVINQQN